MKKYLWILLISFLSCEKSEKEEIQDCWICTETVKISGKTINITDTEVCDVLEVVKLDGRRITNIGQNGKVTTYFTECIEKGN